MSKFNETYLDMLQNIESMCDRAQNSDTLLSIG